MTRITHEFVEEFPAVIDPEDAPIFHLDLSPADVISVRDAVDDYASDPGAEDLPHGVRLAPRPRVVLTASARHGGSRNFWRRSGEKP